MRENSLLQRAVRLRTPLCLPAYGGRDGGAAHLADVGFEEALHVGRADVVVARAMHALVLDDRARSEALREPDVAASRDQIELGARERQRGRARVLLAARDHLFRRHAVLDDLQLGPALDALMSYRRAADEED